MASLEELQQRQQQARIRTLQVRQALARGEVDDQTGAPGRIRLSVGGLTKPADRLATLRQTYPDAQVDPRDPSNFIFTNPETGRLTRYNPPGLDRGDLPSITREGAQFLGGGVGAALGLPLGLPGAAAGGGLGTMAGEEAFNLANRVLGGAQDTRSLGERASETGALGALGAAGEGVGAAAGRAVGGAAKRLFREPEAAQRAVADADRLGVNLSAGQATDSVVLNQVENAVSRLPGGASVIRRVADRTLQKISQNVDELASDLSGRGAARLDPEQAGRAIREGLEGFGDRVRLTGERLFNQVGINPDTPVQASRSVSTLTELTSLPGTGPTVRRLARDIAGAVDSQTGAISYQGLRSLRTRVGSALANGQDALLGDVNRGQLKQLYGSISRDLEDAARKEGPETLAAFKRANRYWNAALERTNDIIDPLIRKNTPEEVFSAAMRGSKDGATRLRAIRRSVTPEQWRVLAGTTIRRLGRAGSGGLDELGEAEFSFSTFARNWRNLDREAKAALFDGRQMGGIREDLDTVVRTVSRILDSSSAFANPSGTGRAIGEFATAAGVGSAAVGAGAAALGTGGAGFFFTLPLVIGAVGVGSNATARLMTSPRFVRWLAEGAKVRPNGIPAQLGRLAAVVEGADADTKLAIQEYGQALQQVLGPPEPERVRREGLTR